MAEVMVDHFEDEILRDVLVVQWLRLHAPSAEELGSILFRELDPSSNK